jgi:hypothetical protein
MAFIDKFLPPAYGHIKRFNFTQLSKIANSNSSTSYTGSNFMQPDRPTLLGKRPAPIASSPASSTTSPLSSKQRSTFQTPSSSKSAIRQSRVCDSRLSTSASSPPTSIISVDENLETESTDTFFGARPEIDQQDKMTPSTSLTISEAENPINAFQDSPSIPFTLAPEPTDAALPAKRRRITKKLD